MASAIKYEDWPEILLLEKAKNELNENSETREQDIQAFRNMALLENVDVSAFRTSLDDEFLLRFLRVRKFDKARALKLLKNYVKVKDKNADVCDLVRNNREQLINVMKELNVISVLPYRTPEGCCVYISRPAAWNPDTEPILDLAAKVLLSTEAIASDSANIVNGAVIIYDPIGVSFYQLRFLTLRWILLLKTLLQDSMPVRIKAIHVVNENKVLYAFFTLLWPFLSRKLKERIHLHGTDYKKLHKFIPAEILPEELGGTAGSYSGDWWCQKLMGMQNLEI